MMKTFNQMSHSGDYKGDEVSVSITVLGGTYGGGVGSAGCSNI